MVNIDHRQAIGSFNGGMRLDKSVFKIFYVIFGIIFVFAILIAIALIFGKDEFDSGDVVWSVLFILIIFAFFAIFFLVYFLIDYRAKSKIKKCLNADDAEKVMAYIFYTAEGIHFSHPDAKMCARFRHNGSKIFMQTKSLLVRTSALSNVKMYAVYSPSCDNLVLLRTEFIPQGNINEDTDL